MKILTDENGQKYEVTDRKDIKFYGASDYTTTFLVRLIPRPQKTLSEVAAEARSMTEQTYRYNCKAESTVADAIERRLQDMQKEIESLKNLRKIEQVYDEGIK